jgi:NAD(P)H-nitrite reductase large subunit
MHLAIIGNGVAGITAARHVRKLDPNARISVISEESDHFYSRTALMYVYMGHLTYGHTKPYQDWFWMKNGIDLIRDRVEHVDVQSRHLALRSGARLAFDRLLIASGSTSAFAGWSGQDLRGVQGLYGLPDLETMESDTRGIFRAVVVGGGLIGIELAEMLHSRGIHVTFLVRDPHYYANVLPAEEGAMVADEIRRQGIDLRLGVQLREALGDATGRVRAVVTTAGEEIAAEFVGIGIGVTPNVGFLDGSGIEVRRGVLVDRFLQTNIEGVYAAGDCTEHRSPPPGRRPTEPIWYAARQQGATVAHAICGRPRAYAPGIYFNSAKFFTVEWQVYGHIPVRPAGDVETLLWQDESRRRSIRIAYRTADQRVVGFNLMGVRYRQVVCERWIREETPLAEVLQDLGAANFDPEFFPQFEREVLDRYNERHPDAPLALRSTRGWRRWMSPDPRGLKGLDILPGRALP